MEGRDGNRDPGLNTVHTNKLFLGIGLLCESGYKMQVSCLKGTQFQVSKGIKVNKIMLWTKDTKRHFKKKKVCLICKYMKYP